MRVVVVENMQGTSLGQVGVALREAGAQIEVYQPHAGQALPAASAAHDALVVLGGEQSARDDASHPYLPALAALMAEHASQGRAVLGICLGAQLLARGCGALNLLGAAPEFGWQAVALTDTGRRDPVLGALPAQFCSFQWHADTFTLPAAAEHLAQSDAVSQQAFRVGRAGYGMQFHFEANRDVVAGWARDFAHLIERAAPGWRTTHPAQAAAFGVESDAAGLALARAWVALI